MRTKFISLVALLLATSLFGEEESDKKIADMVAKLKYRTGTVQLKENLATVKIPDGFKFLDQKQAQSVLTDIWGNPPDDTTLGMLFLGNESPVSDNFSYAVEISYSDDGHIDDEEASEIDFDDLLKSMQEDTNEGNEARKKEGYPTVELVNWAQKPFYDSESKKLHWAKNLKFEGSERNTLNYNIRILGRSGYLNLNIISDMSQLERVNRDLPAILASAEFNSGNLYADFNPEIDKLAAYGIGGLIAGKVLAKVGLFAILAKFGKFIIMGLVAAGYALKRFLGGKRAPSEEIASDETPPPLS